MRDRKDAAWFDNRISEIQDKVDYYLGVKKELKPWMETLKIIGIYVFMGVLWIKLSDKALSLFVQNPETMMTLQTYKGWFYVLITGILFYFIISNKIVLFNKATEEIFEGYEELSSAHEELVALEEELNLQFNELEKHRDALLLSDQRYQLAIEGANDGIWDWDIRANRYFFSLKRKNVFGYQDMELENTFESWKQLLHSDDRERAVRSIKEYLTSQKGIYENTYRLRCKNGEYRWILSHGMAIWDENGAAVRVAGSHTDITEYMLLQESLHKEKEFSQSILYGAYIMIVAVNLDGNIIEFNPFAEKLTGYTKVEVLGKRWFDLLVPDDKRELSNESFRKTLDSQNVKDQENQVITKTGEVFDILWNNSCFHDSEGNISGVIATGLDITERKKMENKLYFLAYYDTLTGLPNRQLFEKELMNTIYKFQKENLKFMLIYMDLDNFKNVNDTLGHTCGDELIRKISNELKTTVKDGTIIARLGGDEFGIILPWTQDIIDENTKIVDIMASINKIWDIEGHDLYISSSLGVAIYPEDGRTFDTLLKNADTAMYVAKENAKNCYAFYTPKMNEKALNYMVMEKDIRKALSNDEFILHYQPIINLRDSKISGVEALIRWIHPTKGIIPPMNFIPFAEESGLILEIGEKVFRLACEQLQSWCQEGHTNIKMSVNLSARQLRQHDLLEKIDYHIKVNDINCRNLVVEITENAALSNFNQSIEVLNNLKAMGIEIALDDFGTGYSSLNYLKQLPVDIIKMDKSFIDDICKDNEKFIAKTVIELAHNLKLSVTAEGIETVDQLDILNSYGCDHGQGFYYSKPVSPKELELLL